VADLKPWLEIATPHSDIRDGSFDESLFAADLGLVAVGKGPNDYRDPELFAQKTFLTSNLKAALVEVGDRLAGDETSAAVFRMQTEFGGGKTHTMLAAYHLFGSPERVEHTKLGRDLAAQLKNKTLPAAKVAVLDGSALRADPERMPDGTVVSSFLGHLAWRLGGSELYETVGEQDKQLLGTSTVQMVELLEAASPCLILLDETLEYLNKALEVRTHEGNLAATTLTVIKELCTAVSNVKGAAVIATLTSSRLEDYASVSGQDMQERLSKVVGRTENIVTPVEGDDIFPILHTRLFESIGDPAARRSIADAYGDYYEGLGDVVPSAYRDPGYRDRIEAAYPFHPELIDILTNRWGSLSGFQRTRGALRTLAHTVKALSQRKHNAALIHPGDVPLADAGVRSEVIRFAGESYKSALNSDIIRSDSKAAEEDRRRGGEIERSHIAVGLATTAFLNSFGADKVVGASAPQMIVGVGRPIPGLTRGVLDDVRDALAGALWYMRYEGGRYRFTTEPNLNKVIVEREGAIGDNRIVELLREAVTKVTGQAGPFRVETGVAESTDVVDEPRLTLGVLDFDLTVGPERTAEVLSRAETILTARGGAARSNKNALALVAADQSGILKARQTARTLAAMRELSNDQTRLKRFNQEQRDQLEDRRIAAEERLPQQLAMAYRHLIFLVSSDGNGSARLETVDLGPARVHDTIPTRVADYLRTSDRLLDSTLAPAALLSTRFGVIPSESEAIEVDRLLSYFYRLPRLPKLATADVLRNCLAQGVESGTFGLSSGAVWDAEDSIIRFKTPVSLGEIQFQPGTWLVRAAAAKRLSEERESQAPPPALPHDPNATHDKRQEITLPVIDVETTPVPPTTRLNPNRLTLRITGVSSDRIRDVLKVTVFPLSAAGAVVNAKIEIVAESASGIPRDTIDMVVLEGLRQLGVEFRVE
jgi:hypothetical protein